MDTYMENGRYCHDGMDSPWDLIREVPAPRRTKGGDQMTEPSFYLASDYAGFRSKNLSAYYGYEVTDPEGNWCFKANFSGREVVIPSTELNCRDTFDPGLGLLAGIAKLFETHEITEAQP